MQTTGIIIQARLGSTRMPWKVVKPFYQGKSILDLQIEALKKNFPDFPIVLATSVNEENDALEELAERLEIGCFRGDENNVLNRFIETAKAYNFTRVVRICSDNPLLYTPSIHELLKQEADYSAFALSDGTPTIRTHYGFWPEVVTTNALEKAQELTNDSFYQEHVTNFIYGNPDEFSLAFKTVPTEIENNRSIRTTIDTPEDFDNIADLYVHLMAQESALDPTAITHFLSQHPRYTTVMKEQIEKNSK